MGSGPQHLAILAEIRLAERSVNRWMGLSLLLLVALIWGLVEQSRVVGWVQYLARTQVAPRLLEED